MGFLLGLLWLSVIVVVLAGIWKVFEKAGQPGWAALVPIYNFYIMLKIIGKPTWWLLMLLIPFLNFVFLIWSYNMISKSFGKDEAYTAGLVLLGFIFWPLLGFGDAKYLGPFGDPEKFRAMQMPSFDFDKKPNA
jgi:hypothetical protein